MKKEEIIEVLTGKKPGAENVFPQKLASRPLTDSEIEQISKTVFDSNNQNALSGVVGVFADTFLDREVSNMLKHAVVCVARKYDILGFRYFLCGFAFNKKGVSHLELEVSRNGIGFRFGLKKNQEGIFESWQNGYSVNSVVEYAKRHVDEIKKTSNSRNRMYVLNENPEIVADAIIKATNYVEGQE